MGQLKIFDGINWVNPCDCGVRIKGVTGWNTIDPNSCVVKYFDGTSWCEITCLEPPCNCPEGYFNDPLTNICTQIVQSPATPNVGAVVYELYRPALTSPPYGDFGARLYSDISGYTYPINVYRNLSIPNTGFGTQYRAYENAGTGIQIPIAFNCSVAALNSTGGETRLQRSSMWAQLPGPGAQWPNSTWLKAEYCIDILEEKEYIIGLAGDNQARITIDSTTFNGGGVTNLLTLFASTNPSGTPTDNSVSEPFRYWHMFPITLPVGTHRFIIEGYNISSGYGFGAEIYDTTAAYMQSAIMTGADSIENYILFSTRQLVITPPLLIPGPSQTVTWTCDSPDSTYSDCYGAPACIITLTKDCI
jgi:hypothetical protein